MKAGQTFTIEPMINAGKYLKFLLELFIISVV